MEQNKETKVTEVKEQENETKAREQENFATEIFHEFKIHSRIAIVGLIILLAIGIFVFFANDERWRNLFSSYDYVAQDGQGYNYYNSEIGGNVNNGAESQKAEEWNTGKRNRSESC